MANNSNTPKPNPAPQQGPIVFRRFITLKNGRVLDAHDYGLKAWPIGAKR
jgi:hypothetical protein